MGRKSTYVVKHGQGLWAQECKTVQMAWFSLDVFLVCAYYDEVCGKRARSD